MSRDSAKAHYTKQAGDPDEGYITASDAQAAIDDIYDDMAGPAVIADGSVTTGKIATDAVTSAQIATGAVGSSELAADSVTADKIDAGAVSDEHVAADAAIAASKIDGVAVTQADTGTVTDGMLAGSIAKTKVAGTAITAADTGTVTGSMIGAGEVGNGNLAANAVNAAKIASGAVTTVKIEDDAVTTDKIAADAVTSAEIAANAVGASELADNAVDTAAIAADAVTADKIANDTITAAELAANSVGTSELANDSVTAAKILDGTITANEIQNASITGAKLVNDTITATQIAADAVGSSEIAANAVGTSEIADSAVTSAKIANGTIVAADVAADTFAAFGTVGNLLTSNVASGTDTLGTTAGFTSQSGTLTSTNADAWQGSRSVQLAWSGVTGRVVVGGNAGITTADGTIPLTPGQTYTAHLVTKLVSGTVPSGALVVRTFQSDGTTQTGDFSATVTNMSSAWTVWTVTFVAPASAAMASMYWLRNGGGGADTITRYDGWGIWKGTGGQWALPGVPIPGQGAIKANGAVELPGGDYAPEGMVTANPGSTFLQTSGAATVTGMLSWRKATGTGSTGWVPEGRLADTGSRNLAGATMLNGWAVQYSAHLIRRIGNVVDYSGIINNTSATANAFFAIQSGFRPIGTVRTAVWSQDPTKFWRLEIGSNAEVSNFDTHAAGTFVYFHASWLTDNAWPTSLPGA